MGFEFDIAQFNGSLERLAKHALPASIERGLGRAGMQALRDSALEAPAVPIDEGTLTGSGSVLVENRLVGTSEDLAAGGTPARDDSEPILPTQKTAVIGFNVPYAAYQHEGMRADGSHVVQNYSPQSQGRSAGPKFLEKKLAINRELYIKIVGNTLKRDIG